MTIKAGQFFLFSNLTVHGSGPNNSELTRLGIGARFTSTDVRVYPGVSIDGQGMSLDNYGCVLVRGENGFEHNRMRMPPEARSRIGETPAGMDRRRDARPASRPDTGSGTARVSVTPKKASALRSRIAKSSVGASLDTRRGLATNWSMRRVSRMASAPGTRTPWRAGRSILQYGTPGEMGGMRGGRRRGPIFRVLRALKRLTKKI